MFHEVTHKTPYKRFFSSLQPVSSTDSPGCPCAFLVVSPWISRIAPLVIPLGFSRKFYLTFDPGTSNLVMAGPDLVPGRKPKILIAFAARPFSCLSPAGRRPGVISERGPIMDEQTLKIYAILKDVDQRERDLVGQKLSRLYGVSILNALIFLSEQDDGRQP